MYFSLTQSKTLAGDSSVMFSPPSIVKNAFLEESTSLHSFISVDNTPEPKFEDLDIEAVITEKTKVQHRSLPHTNPLPNTLDPLIYQYETTPFRDITNIDTNNFVRLNADRLRTITSSNDISCDNLIAPKDVLANAFADHIYKVTNQKPSTSRIDEILTNKINRSNEQKENQWCGVDENDTGQADELFSSNYYMFTNL